jgi:RND family efflux transporter MFP subunit
MTASSPPPVRRPGRAYGLVGCMLLGCGTLAGCSTAGSETPALPARTDRPRVVIDRAEPCTLDERVRLIGHLESRSSLQLGFVIPGRVRRLDVEVGSTVHAGATLARLDTRERDAQLAVASSSRRAAQEGRQQANRELERADLLLEREIDSAEAHENKASALRRAEALVAVAESEYRVVAAALRQTELIAPADGVISELHVDPGEVVGAGQPVLRLEPTQPRLELRLRVPEHLLDRFAIGADLSGRPLGGGPPFRARVRWLGAVPEGRAYVQQLVADLELDADAEPLQVGIAVEADVPAAAAASLCVPLGAVSYAAPARTGVFVVDETGRVEFSDVEVGRWDATHISIAHGLVPGQRVVARGVEGLRSGTQVEEQGAP